MKMEKPEMEVILFNETDIIVTSGCGTGTVDGTGLCQAGESDCWTEDM